MAMMLKQGKTAILHGLQIATGFSLVGILALSGATAANAITLPDTQAPKVQFETVTPTTVVLDSGLTDVTTWLELTDETGVDAPVINLSHDATSQSQGFGRLTLVEGSIKDGAWERVVSLAPDKALGAWSVNLYPLQDLLGNRTDGFRTLAQVEVFASEIESIERPDICGTMQVGQTVSSCGGSWSPTGNVKESFQWQRNGESINGATSKSYVLTPADLGAAIAVEVTAKWNKRGEEYYYAPARDISLPKEVGTGTFSSTTTKVSGTGVVGDKISVDLKSWKPVPQSTKYEWLRDGVQIEGATSPQYVPIASDIGANISVRATGTHAGYVAASGESEGLVVKPITAPEKPKPEKPKPEKPKPEQPKPKPEKPKPTPPAKPVTFTDIPKNHKFGKEIAWMAETGLSTGVNTATGKAYQPKNKVTREAMAAFLYRLNTPKGATAPEGFTVPKDSPFADVNENHKFFKEIAWMHSSGLSTGIKQKNGKPAYAPKDGVSREAMAAFMFRMIEKPGYQAASESPFADIDTKHKFYTQIEWMNKKKLSTGVKQADGSRHYQDKVGVSREAMAAFLYRSQH